MQQEPSLLAARRNSLPPLRGVGTTSCSGNLQQCVSISGSIGAAAAGLDRSGSFGLPSSPGSVRPASPLSPAAAAVEGPGGCSSSSSRKDAVPLQHSSSGAFARLRSGSMGVGGLAASGTVGGVDAAAMQQLAAVRQAQADSYR
jgi:hypothetical protein